VVPDRAAKVDEAAAAAGPEAREEAALDAARAWEPELPGPREESKTPSVAPSCDLGRSA
jgi:hypothetical protein